MSRSSSKQFNDVAGESAESQPPRFTPVANNSSISNRARARPARLLLICGLLLAAAVTVGTGLILSNLRERALIGRESVLRNIALIVAEQTNRAFQAADLIQTHLIERMHSLGVASGEDFEREMSGRDVHLTLKDKIGSLPHIDALMVISARGKLINSSRTWPIPEVNASDQDYFKALQSDPRLTSFLSAPVRDGRTGAWTIYLAQKFVGPNGEFLGLLCGAMELQYFEKLFETLILGEESAISLFRDDGVLLVRYPQRDSPGTSYAGGDLFTKALSRANHRVVRLTSVVDGKKRLVAGHSVADYPISVAVATTVSAALAGWQGAAIYMISTAVLLILVIGTTILLGVKQFKNFELLAQARAENDQKVQLDAALNNMRQGLQMYDAKGRVTLTSQKYLKMYGLSPDAVKPDWTIRDVLHLRKAAGTLAGDPDQYLAKRIDRGKVETKVVQIPDGRTISVTNAPVPGGGWVSTHEDISESKRREASFRLLFESNPLPMWVFDVDTIQFLAVNDAAVAHYGYSREQFLAMTLADIRPIEDRERLVQLVRSDPGTQKGEEIWRHRKADGSEIEVSVYSRALRHEDRRAVLVAICDVTEQRQADRERVRSEERIVHLAHHDALTDLPNRALFCEELDRALARVKRGERLALLYLDLDHFKHVNDTHGHLLGDELLKAVAERLRGCVRETDFVARLGGDEFAIIQTLLEQHSDPTALATRISDALNSPLNINGHEVVVGVSIGISIAPNDAIEREQILKNADLALYGAKGGGRGTYCFYEPEMDTRVKARQKVEADLRDALANGEFELYYQPIVNLQSNQVSGCEALLRWHHPERGMVAPAEFIPIAEESGLIISLGEWVLRRACADAATWPDDIKIAVNLSPAQLAGGKLLPMVVSALAASGIPGGRLELEITETLLMQNTFATLATLHQLRDMGVRIAMDDFGTGYSSLSYLKSFPFDNIKIDRSFIEDISETDDCASIVQAVTNMAQQLNMKTTAEGVETEQQLEKVRELGCTEMQGYIFSPARPAAEISRLFLSRAVKAASAA